MENVKILSGNVGIPLADNVCRILGVERWPAAIGRFNDGEVNAQVLRTVRNRDVYIINPTNPPLENAFELVLLSQAIKTSAKSITLVIPYLGYDRQDRKDKSRVPIGAKSMAELLMTSEADRMIFIDPHSEPTLGFFHGVKVERFYASYMVLPYLRDIIDDNTVFASPDAGGVSRVRAYGNRLGITRFAVFFKSRPAPGEIDADGMIVAGDVSGKKVIFIDDIIDTAGSTIEAAKAAKTHGASEICICATHGLFSKGAVTKLVEAKRSGIISEIIITDTIPRADGFFPDELNINVISVADLIAEVIDRIESNKSLSALFVEDEYHCSQELAETIGRCPHYIAPENGCGKAGCACRSNHCSVKTWADLGRCKPYQASKEVNGN